MFLTVYTEQFSCALVRKISRDFRMFKFAILIMAVSAVLFGHQLDSKSPVYVLYTFIYFFFVQKDKVLLMIEVSPGCVAVLSL